MIAFRPGVLFRFLAAGFLMAAMAAKAEDGAVETVTMVQDAEYPPYMADSAGGATGIYAAIVREAGRRLPDYRIDLTATPWSRALHLVRNGKVNALVGTYEVPQERPWLGRYSAAIMYESIYVYCRKGIARKTWSYPEDFEGLTFGNNRGFQTPGPEFFDLVAQGRLFLNEEQTTAINLRLLHFGRIDCYVQDKTVVDPILAETGYENIEPVRQLNYRSVHVGFGKSWQSDKAAAFIDAFDGVLADMKKDGTIDRIVFRNVVD